MGRGASDELRSLGAAFSRMTAKLQARDDSIAAMQQELAASEGHHRLLTDNASDLITRFSPEFQCLYVSPACRELLGYELGFATVSMGIAALLPDIAVHGPAALVEAADWALYEAKRAGRNTFRLAGAWVAAEEG